MIEQNQSVCKINVLIASIATKAQFEPIESLCDATIVQVDNGEEAMELLSSNSYDLLISDYALLDIDIWRLVALIRSGRYCKDDLPVLLLYRLDDPAIPEFLSRDFGFSSLALNDLTKAPKVIGSLLRHNNIQPRVLIIEDNADAANIAKCALQAQYNVQVETTGEIGLGAWKKDAHDIVVLDLMLPGMHGRSVLDEIISINPDQPVIIVTAYSEEERHIDYALNGASEFLSKPYTLSSLRNACRNATVQSKWLSMIRYHRSLLKYAMKYSSATDLSLKAGNMKSAVHFSSELMKTMRAYLPTDDELSEFMVAYRSE